MPNAPDSEGVEIKARDDASENTAILERDNVMYSSSSNNHFYYVGFIPTIDINIAYLLNRQCFVAKSQNTSSIKKTNFKGQAWHLLKLKRKVTLVI